MKKQSAVRLYKLADGVLKQKADEFLALLDRDEVEFTDRGYNAAARENFSTAISAVNQATSDETYEAAKMVQTAAKDASRSALEKSMRTIYNMAANKFGNRSAQYRAFGNADISRQSDAELVRTSKVLIATANANLAALATEGLTDEKIEDLSSQAQVLDADIDTVAQGISDRDIATEARIELLNKLYELLIKYAGIGQDIFYEVNEAKYNDYIIYDTPSGLPVEPPVNPVPPVSP